MKHIFEEVDKYMIWGIVAVSAISAMGQYIAHVEASHKLTRRWAYVVGCLIIFIPWAVFMAITENYFAILSIGVVGMTSGAIVFFAYNRQADLDKDDEIERLRLELEAYRDTDD